MFGYWEPWREEVVKSGFKLSPSLLALIEFVEQKV